MIRWIIISVILFLAYRLVRRFIQAKAAPSGPEVPTRIQDEMVQDPVCETYVPKRLAVAVRDPRGKDLFFCSAACRDKYLEEKRVNKNQ